MNGVGVGDGNGVGELLGSWKGVGVMVGVGVEYGTRRESKVGVEVSRGAAGVHALRAMDRIHPQTKYIARVGFLEKSMGALYTGLHG